MVLVSGYHGGRVAPNSITCSCEIEQPRGSWTKAFASRLPQGLHESLREMAAVLVQEIVVVLVPRTGHAITHLLHLLFGERCAPHCDTLSELVWCGVPGEVACHACTVAIVAVGAECPFGAVDLHPTMVGTTADYPQDII